MIKRGQSKAWSVSLPETATRPLRDARSVVFWGVCLTFGQTDSEHNGREVAVLELLGYFDWISPLVAMLQTIKHGRGHAFYVGLDSGWTGAQCDRILKDAGITVYGRCIAKGDAFFQVPTAQAEWAEYLLLRAGVPLKYRLYSKRNAQYLIGGVG